MVPDQESFFQAIDICELQLLKEVEVAPNAYYLIYQRWTSNRPLCRFN